MNGRIKELMRGAIADAWMQSDRAGDMDKMYIPELFAENFAELIVKECAKVCYRTGVLEQDERTGWVYGDAIQEHFGVE